MIAAQTAAIAEPAFKLVCSECGSISVKFALPVRQDDGAVECSRCGAYRGTYRQLHDLSLRTGLRLDV